MKIIYTLVLSLLLSTGLIAQKNKRPQWSFEIDKGLENYNYYNKKEPYSSYALKYFVLNKTSINIAFNKVDYWSVEQVGGMDFNETHFFQSLGIFAEQRISLLKKIQISPSIGLSHLYHIQSKSREINNDGTFKYMNPKEHLLLTSAQIKLGYLFFNRVNLGIKTRYEVTPKSNHKFLSYGVSLDFRVNFKKEKRNE